MVGAAEHLHLVGVRHGYAVGLLNRHGYAVGRGEVLSHTVKGEDAVGCEALGFTDELGFIFKESSQAL